MKAPIRFSAGSIAWGVAAWVLGSPIAKTSQVLPQIASTECSGAGVPASAVDGRQDESVGSVFWSGAEHRIDELPEDFPKAAREPVQSWSPWAVSAGYRLDLDAQGRVLFVTREGDSKRETQLALIDDVLAHFERVLPAPDRLADAPVVQAESDGAGWRDAGSSDDDGPLPEDPEDPGHPWGAGIPAEETSSERTETRWGAVGPPSDSETVLLFGLRGESGYRGFLEALGAREPSLREWTRDARQLTGFVLARPLIGAYVDEAARVEEWNPDNEVVNRLARLLLMRRFGHLPNWVAQGWAWHVELEVCRSIYCFPYRNNFVGVEEHTGWDKVLQRRFAERKGVLLDPSEFAGWERGVYVDEQAQLAWAVVDHLVEKHHKELPALLEALRASWQTRARVDMGNGRWALDATFVLPVEAQGAILEAHLGEKIWKELTRALSR